MWPNNHPLHFIVASSTPVQPRLGLSRNRVRGVQRAKMAMAPFRLLVKVGPDRRENLHQLGRQRIVRSAEAKTLPLAEPARRSNSMLKFHQPASTASTPSRTRGKSLDIGRGSRHLKSFERTLVTAGAAVFRSFGFAGKIPAALSAKEGLRISVLFSKPWGASRVTKASGYRRQSLRATSYIHPPAGLRRNLKFCACQGCRNGRDTLGARVFTTAAPQPSRRLCGKMGPLLS